jgi:hypothetical protein
MAKEARTRRHTMTTAMNPKARSHWPRVLFKKIRSRNVDSPITLHPPCVLAGKLPTKVKDPPTPSNPKAFP